MNVKWINILVLLLLLLLSATSFAREGNLSINIDHPKRSSTPKVSHSPQTFSVPKLSKTAINVQSIEGGLASKLRFNPVIKKNLSQGTYSSEISVKLPPNLAGFQNLKLIYQHSEVRNVGLGIGWTWNLPELHEEKDPLTPSEYILTGLLGTHRLIKTNENLGSLKREIDKISKNLFGQPTQFNFQTYRPDIDENFHFLVKILNQGWIIFLTNGKRWVLDKNGQSIAIVDLHQNMVLFEWKNSLLQTVQGKSGLWKGRISYLDKNQFSKLDIPLSTKTGFHRLPIGIESIQFSESRLLQFAYDNEGYLLRAGWKGALLPSFQAKYERIQPPEPAIVYDNRIKRHDTGIIIHRNFKGDSPEDEKELAGQDFTSPYTYTYVDLNGDGRTDKIRWHDHEYTAAVDSLVRGKRGNTQIDVPHTVFLAIADKPGEKFKYVQQDTLHLPDKITPVEWHESKGNVTYFPANINFVDINHDGRKDLIYCVNRYNPGNNSSIYHTVKAPGNIIISKPDRFQNEQKSLRTFPNLVVQILKMFGQSQNLGHGHFTKPLNHLKRIRAKIFLQKIDIGEFKNAKSNKYQGSTLLNSKWDEIDTNLDCNASALFTDANLDGNIDVLTGDALYLGGKEPGKYSVKLVDNGKQTQFLKNFFEKTPETITLEDTDVLLADLDNNGKFEVRQSRYVGKNPLTGITEVVRVGKIEKRQVPPRRKLISEFISPHGGKYEIKYQFRGGIWTLHQVVKLPDSKSKKSNLIQQPIAINQYEFLGDFRDKHYGKVIGFEKSIERRTLNWNDKTAKVTPVEIVSTYLRKTDADTLFFYSTPKVSGKVVKRAIVHGDNLFEYRTTKNEYQFIPISNGRIFPLASKTTKIHAEPGSTEKKILDQTLFVGDWFKNRRGEFMMPRTISKLEKDRSTQETRSDLKEYTYFDRIHHYDLSRHQTLGNDSSKTLPILKLERNQNTGKLRKACYQDPNRIFGDLRCQQFRYDNLGRLTATKSKLGFKQLAKYEKNRPLPSVIKDSDGSKVSKAYDWLTGDLTQFENPFGAVFTQSYTADGVKTKVKVSKNETHSQNFYTFQNGAPKLCDVTAGYCQAEQSLELAYGPTHLTWLLDGLGRVEDKVYRTSFNKFRTSGRKMFSESDKVIRQYLPINSEKQKQKILIKTGYDALDRPWRTVRRNKDEFLEAYTPYCTISEFNRSRVSKECVDAFGNLSSQSIGTDSIEFGMTTDGILKNIPSLGLRWDQTGFGEIRYAVSESYRGSSKNEDGLGDWASLTRHVLKKGRVRDDSDGNLWIYDKNGRLKTFRRKKGYKIYVKSTDVSERNKYKAGLLETKALTFKDGQSLTLRYRHDELGQSAGISGLGFKLSETRDVWGKLERIKLKRDSKKKLDLFYERHNGEITTLIYNTGGKNQILVSNIKRDRFGKVTSYKLAKSGKVRRKYRRYSNLLSSITVYGNSKKIWKEALKYNNQNQIIKRTKASKLAKKLTETFKYDQGNYTLLSQALQKNHKRDDRGRTTTISKRTLKWNGENLDSINDQKIYYNASGQAFASCPKKVSKPVDQSKFCSFLLSENFFVYRRKPVLKIELEGHIVGIYFDGQVYPVVEDQLGSVRLMLSTTGNQILWERDYDSWGNKKFRFSKTSLTNLDKLLKLEQVAIWSFARLKELPGIKKLGNAPFYFSNSRIYSPAIRQWLSPDPLVKWNPQSLLNRPGNWRAFQYASGDPLMFVDPSGNNTLVAAAIVGGAIGYGGYKVLKHFDAVDKKVDKSLQLADQLPNQEQQMITKLKIQNEAYRASKTATEKLAEHTSNFYKAAVRPNLEIAVDSLSKAQSTEESFQKHIDNLETLNNEIKNKQTNEEIGK